MEKMARPVSALFLFIFILFTLQANAGVVPGDAWTCGQNTYGQLGQGTADAYPYADPAKINGPGSVVAASAGMSHTVVLKSDGTVWSAGANNCGQLGDGTGASRNTFVQVGGLTGVAAVAAGDYFTAALKSDGTVWAWGSNSRGQLGLNRPAGSPFNPYPVQVYGISGAKAVAAGSEHVLALLPDGTIWGWGRNDYGQLGNGVTAQGPTSRPVMTSGFGYAAVASGAYHSLALKQDGSVWAWGRNVNGELGDGTPINRPSPVPASGLRDAVAVAGGMSHSIALKSDGSVWTWGMNAWGELGDGTQARRLAPVLSPYLGDTAAIAGGGAHTRALKKDGTIWSCGYNGYGELGAAPAAAVAIPVQASGLSGVSGIFGGGNVLIAVTDGAAAASEITSPSDGALVAGPSITISGTASDEGSGVASVEVSANDGFTWVPAVETSRGGWSAWSFEWTLPLDGVYKLQSRALDKAGNLEEPGPGVSVTIDNTKPVSAITYPSAGAVLSGAGIAITGSAFDPGSVVKSVFVSADGGVTWSPATDASGNGSWSSWSLACTLPAYGEYTIVSRAEDNAGNIETPGGAVVRVNFVRHGLLLTYDAGSRTAIAELYSAGSPVGQAKIMFYRSSGGDKWVPFGTAFTDTSGTCGKRLEQESAMIKAGYYVNGKEQITSEAIKIK